MRRLCIGCLLFALGFLLSQKTEAVEIPPKLTVVLENAEVPPQPPAAPFTYRPAGRAFRTSLDLIADYLSAKPEQGGEQVLAETGKSKTVKRTWNFQFVIVTIPGNEYGYDSHLVAVQRAAASLGYRVQSQWLPAPGEASGAHPGVILLRPPRLVADSNRTKERLELDNHLLIYVVDESPNGGISLPAFEQALTQIDCISTIQSKFTVPGDLATVGQKVSVSILGPTFSSSRTSLALGLANSKFSKAFAFNIVSGRASSNQNSVILDRMLDKSGVDYHFKTAMHSIRSQLQAMLDYICLYEDSLGNNKFKHGAPQVALLIESSTNWGQELQQAVAGNMSCNNSDQTMRLLVLPYQINIGESAQPSAPPRPHGAAVSKSEQSDTQPAAAGGAQDPPTLRSGSGQRSEERALTSLLRTIAQEQIWYVGVASLTATDKYLLLRQVHELMPGVQLFALDADLNDTHPDYLVFTKGMLTASTYPVFNKSQLWQWPLLGDTQRIQFSRSRDIGVYNAFIFLLADRNPDEKRILRHLIGYGPALIEEENPPQTEWVPSLWISRVTGEGVIPVKEYIQHAPPKKGNADNAGNSDNPPNPIRTLNTTGNWMKEKKTDSDSYFGVRRTGAFDVIIVISSLYFTISLIIYILHRFFCDFIDQHPELNLFGLFSLPHRPASASSSTAHPDENLRKLQSTWLSRFYRFLYFLILAVFIAILQRHSLPLTRRTHWADGSDAYLFEYGTEIFMAFLFGFLVVTCVDAALGGCQSDIRKKDEIERIEANRYFIFGGLISISYSIVMFASSSLWMKGLDQLLYLERATNFSSGLSILAPWLCLLFLLIAWAAANRHRIGLLARINEDFGDLHDAGDPAELGAIAFALGGTWNSPKSEEQPLRIKPAIIGGVSVVGALIYLYIFHTIITYESYSTLLGLGFSFAYCAIIVEFVNFVVVAYYFDRSLLRLGSEPMFDAYLRLPVHFSRNVGIQILESLDSHIEYQSIRTNMAILKTHYERIVYVIKKNQSHDIDLLRKLFGDTAGSLLAMPIPDIKDTAAKTAESKPSAIARKLYKLLTDDLNVPSNLLSVDSRSDDLQSHHKPLHKIVADGVATVAEFLQAVNSERPLPSSVQPLVSKSSDKADERGPDKLDMDVNRVRSVGTRELLTKTLPDSLHLWLRQAEDLVAIQRVMFINRIFSALRSQLAFVAVGFVLLLLAFNLFPFQPLRLMMTVLGALMLVILPVTLWIFIRLERDEVLSYISHSPPGQLSLTGPFIGRLIAYIGVPLLTFLIAQIPWLRALFVEVISPILMGLR